MTTIPRLATTVVAALAAVALAAGPASAAASGRIVSADSGDGEVTVVFGGSDLGDQGIDPSTVRLTLDGTAVPAEATALGNDAADVKRTSVVVIDTSGSMTGAGLAAAKTAAAAFLDAVPADVSVGLVTFSDRPSLLVAPTKDRGALRTAVAGLKASGETALYDAVELAVKTAGTTGVRSIVVLSDGGDTRSRATLPQVVGRVGDAKVTLDAVGFRTSESQNTALQQLATAGHGKVVAGAQAAAIAQAFADAAKALANQVVVHGTVPKALAGHSVTVAVSALAGATRINDAAFVHLAAAPKTAKPADYGPIPVTVEAKHISKSAFYGALAALFVGLAALLGIGLTAARKAAGEMRIRRRLSVYSLSGKVVEERHEEGGALGDSAIARSATELAGRVVAKRGIGERLQRKLEAGAIPLKPAEWLVIHALIAVGAALALLLVSGGKPLWALLGLVLGALLPLGYLSVKESRRTAAFLAQLPDTLNLMAGSLTAGYSLPQAVDAVVREGAEPIVSEFNRALVDARLGVPIEDALESVADRMNSEDFGWVVMAIRIQRDVGGNLAEILKTVSETLRERERLRRQVRVLSAEGRLSGLILGALPPVFGAYLLLTRPDYLKPMLTDPAGLAMLGVGGVMMLVGALWMRQVVKVEV